MPSLTRLVKKPEYFYRPQQVLKRLSEVWRGHQSASFVQLLWGHKKFMVNPSETIGKSILHFGLYDLALSEAIYRRLGANSVCVDVGANVGYFSSLMGHFGAEVYAFEPHLKIFDSLQSNCRDIPGIYPFPKALSDRVGTAKLHIPSGFENNEGIASLDPRAGSTTMDIETTTLDKQFPDQTIDILKVDVEGHELSVFNGAETALREDRIKNIFFEDFDGPESRVIKYLEAFNFQVYRIKKQFSRFDLVSPQDGANIPPWEPPNYFASKASLEWAHPGGWSLLKL